MRPSLAELKGWEELLAAVLHGEDVAGLFPAGRCRIRILGLQSGLCSDLRARQLRNLRDEPIAELEIVGGQHSAGVDELIREENLGKLADRRLQPALVQGRADANDGLEEGTDCAPLALGQTWLELEDDGAAKDNISCGCGHAREGW